MNIQAWILISSQIRQGKSSREIVRETPERLIYQVAIDAPCPVSMLKSELIKLTGIGSTKISSEYRKISTEKVNQ
ncbi:MAG TPA: hypothetical protein ENH28_05955 [Euryarchaeota archaeon]|nr:hypothetical protein BMS3Bbin15_01168 [archaeon BMS3Bbin15]HDL15676.1 hypothetical protein [Euryarchaeota archaeon]